MIIYLRNSFIWNNNRSRVRAVEAVHSLRSQKLQPTDNHSHLGSLSLSLTPPITLSCYRTERRETERTWKDERRRRRRRTLSSSLASHPNWEKSQLPLNLCTGSLIRSFPNLCQTTIAGLPPPSTLLKATIVCPCMWLQHSACKIPYVDLETERNSPFCALTKSIIESNREKFSNYNYTLPPSLWEKLKKGENCLFQKKKLFGHWNQV